MADYHRRPRPRTGGLPRPARQERAGHRRQLRHRPGDRRALRRVRRQRRDQLPAPARGGRTTPRSRCTPASRKVQQEGVRDVLVQRRRLQRGRRRAHGRRGDRAASAASTSSSTTPASRSRGRPRSSSSADFDRVLAVNLRGSFLCAREAIRHFLAEEKPGVDHQRLERPPADPQARATSATRSARAGCRT